MNKTAPFLLSLFLTFSISGWAVTTATHPFSPQNCDAPLSSVVDLTPLLHPKTYPSTGQWLLGEGGEGQVHLIKENNLTQIEKVFFANTLAELSETDLVYLHSLHLKSFHLLNLLSAHENVHRYNYVPGISLWDLMKDENIPVKVRENLWELYVERLVSLVKEFSKALPDRFIKVRGYGDFGIEDRLGDIPKASWSALVESPGVRAYREKYPFAQRVMIILNSRPDEQETKGRSFQPKPDNILVNLQTWEMTWIDPN
jgi:hypothetical protein